MGSLPLTSAPDTICLLRLSAIGDISHTLPIVRTLQAAWPETRLSWVIGKTEHALVGDIPGIEFIVFDKRGGLSAYAELWRILKHRRFDVLLDMQMSLRASLISLLIKADIRLGFDRERAKDYQWLFTNHKIAPRQRQHVLESFFGFSAALGVDEQLLRWDIPIPEEAHQRARALLPEGREFIVISPCSSMPYRNWSAEGYAAVADAIAREYGLDVVLTGGPSAIEREYGERITQLSQSAPLNLIGQTSLKELLAILERARAVIAPDSGPAHLATAVQTPVVGLYACTNPDRARPYLSAASTVNRYPEAVQAKYGKTAAELPWGLRVKEPGTMDRIQVQDVMDTLHTLLHSPQAQ